MNSLFSSFDALSAELLGHFVKSSFSSTVNSQSRVLSSEAMDNLKRKEEGDRKSPATPKQKRSAPRLAPEFDGLNCFETLENVEIEAMEFYNTSKGNLTPCRSFLAEKIYRGNKTHQHEKGGP